MREANGRFQPGHAGKALERFLRNCAHDPITGCVVWTGGTTAGHGHHARYGAFWFEGRRWAAHRWAAKHLHGQQIDGNQVDHCCARFRHGGPEPLAPNTLCIQHVQAVTSEDNRVLQTARHHLLTQGTLDRKYWVYVQVGLLEPPAPFAPDPTGVPFYHPPEWLVRHAA